MMMGDKRASVLAISLWILIMLAMLAVSVGHRVSMGLRMSKYQRDAVRAVYAAKAVSDKMITELEKDINSFDAYTESWADNSSIFKKYSLEESEGEYGMVTRPKEAVPGSEDVIAYGASDEEGRIDINKADKPVILQALKVSGVDIMKAGDLAENIIQWKKSPVDPLLEKEYLYSMGYSCKGSSFSSTEELILVKGMRELTQEKFEKLKSMATIYGTGNTVKVNINTASEDVLKALAMYGVTLVGSTDVNDDDAAALVVAFRDFRITGKYFEPGNLNTGAIRVSLGLEDTLSDNRTKILDALVTSQVFSAVSSNFRIEATGIAGGVAKTLTIIYNPDSHKTVFWHER